LPPLKLGPRYQPYDLVHHRCIVASGDHVSHRLVALHQAFKNVIQRAMSLIDLAGLEFGTGGLGENVPGNQGVGELVDAIAQLLQRRERNRPRAAAATLLVEPPAEAYTKI